MDPVKLVELGLPGDALQEEGDEGDPVFLGKRRVNRAKRARIVLAHALRHPHAGQDNPRRRVPRSHAVDDRLQVCPCRLRRRSAQAVVRPQLQDKHVHALAKDPVDPPQAAGARLAAQPGVDHMPRQALGIDLHLDLGGVGLGVGIGEAVARRQAVSKEHDRVLVGRAC